MLKSKPDITQAHRVRSVMQNYYFIQNNAMKISKDGILSINIDMMVYVARQMLAEIVKIQMSGDFAAGEKYVLENFIWTPEMEIMSQKLKKISKRLNGKTSQPLADKLFEEKI